MFNIIFKEDFSFLSILSVTRNLNFAVELESMHLWGCLVFL